MLIFRVEIMLYIKNYSRWRERPARVPIFNPKNCS